MMESLLTPAESMAFQSFLSSVDNSQPPGDWATYASQFSGEVRKNNHDLLNLDSLPSPQGNDTLTQATKDLMSLDDGMWGDNRMVLDHSQSQPQQQHSFYDHLGQLQHPHPHQQHQHQQQQQHQHQQPLQIQSPQPMAFPTAHDAFPFLNNSKSQLQQQDFFQQQQQLQQPYPHDPIQHFNYPSQSFHHGNQLNGSSINGVGISFGTQQQHQPPQPTQPQQAHIPPAISHTHSQSSVTSSSTAGAPSKRPIRAASLSSASSPAAGPSSTAKRGSRSSSSQSPNRSGPPSKPALLSPSQKKANHIQSEQKRRANIRRGYEALCETVPALREAIREEEEEAKAAALAAAAGLPPKSKSAKKRSGKKKEGEEGSKDKIDGRAGPRSENVVLSKTIDYINDLLADRASLLARLQRARAMLPPGHPALVPLVPNPLWEREWKGGEGKEGNTREEGEESEAEEDTGSPNPNAPKSGKGARKKGTE
ncbi:hypothetical protein CC1G_11173 [Coprinopsis cinerea okayama7|uniref:BHLH domain-containing protein n=1 Tax=Coprinopsis cinerea (strain Okayama-7 / 130 / ATCC MYA-4618 / FGSC 9003) TaxID=240176 RepID=A8P4D6_COPC7|nr:hypothetical protein CC1G_11173 [Coprinopsis cinerea okayama7\|eukprot:XP_001838730.1 hypothetical protein CC1G_11173 [Coprinopsis cinerea okayama7\